MSTPNFFRVLSSLGSSLARVRQTQSTMTFIASTLPPWDKVVYTMYTPTTTGYRIWMKNISGDLPSKESVEWLGAWMRTAKPGDVVHLNDDHQRCGEGEGDVAIQCDV